MKKVRIIAAALCAAVSLCWLCVPALADGESWETVDTGTRPHTEAVETAQAPEPASDPVPAVTPESTPTPEPTITIQPESTPKVETAPAVTVPATTMKPKAETPVSAKAEPVQAAAPVSEAAEAITANDSVAKPVDDTADTAEKADNPFTPAGTSSVVDNADDTDGKEFFTITTADGNVFYLVIDRQRGTENVYFLNTVTESDLIALAELPEGAVTQPIPTNEPEPVPTQEPEDNPEPEPETPAKKGVGALPVILAVALIGGGAAWYFKVYRPKQTQAAAADDYDASEYADYMDEDDTPPWDEDEEVDGE